jgi:5-methylcytosine-specific restriction endonuclease McrA
MGKHGCKICQKTFAQEGQLGGTHENHCKKAETVKALVEENVEELFSGGTAQVEYCKKTREELIAICKEMNIKGYSGKKKNEIVDLLLEKQGEMLVIPPTDDSPFGESLAKLCLADPKGKNTNHQNRRKKQYDHDSCLSSFNKDTDENVSINIINVYSTGDICGDSSDDSSDDDSSDDDSSDDDSSDDDSSDHSKINHTKPNTSKIRKKKRQIPATIKRLVWNKYIGESIGKNKCYCCKLTDITQLSFHCGHVISENNGGKIDIDNLRPICQNCNSSMGTKNMNEFINEYQIHK